MKIFHFLILYGNSQVASSLFLFSQVQSYFPGSGGGGSVIHAGREHRSSLDEQKHAPRLHFICIKLACFLLKPCTRPHPGTSEVLFTQHRMLFPPSHPQTTVRHSSFTVSSESVPIMMTFPLIIQTGSCALFSARERMCLVIQSCLTLWPPWTVARQAPLSMGFPRQEYWNGLPFRSAGDLANPGIEPTSPALAGGFFYHCATWEAQGMGPHCELSKVCNKR